MLGPHAVRTRAALKSHKLIKECVTSWWQNLRAISGDEQAGDADCSLETREYISTEGISKHQFCTLIQSVHHLLDPAADEVSEEELHRDWINDKTDDVEYMGFDEFYSSMYELCDLWVDDLDLKKYG
jgi:hypothetical protein